MKKIFVISALLLLALNAQSQIKIEAKGRVTVGPDYGYPFDQDTVLSMSIQGPKTTRNNAGSKLAFGDFGHIVNNGLGGWNVFIGEYDTIDSDIMWLHGKKGIRLTEHNGDRILAEFGCDGNSRTVFYNGIRTGQVMVSSEDGFKSNLVPISNALSRLLQLGSVTYKYTIPKEFALTSEARERLSDFANRNSTGNNTILSGKDREDSVRMARADSIRAAGTSLYGFVTSDIRLLFPELVETDSDGNSYIDYNGLIPVIVAALNEQQQTIEYLTAKLQECCANNSSDDDNDSYNSGQQGNSKSSSDIMGSQSNNDAPVLYQNMPNPFNSTTTIHFHIPENTSASTLYVFSLNGTLIQTFPINATGDGTVSIDGSSLAAGMYVYTLVVDGKIVDSKRMILTN